MRTDRRLLLKSAAAALALAFAGVALAQAPLPKAVAETPMLDPWVPPAVRAKAMARGPAPEPTRGEALRSQAQGKLRARFEAAATGGVLTREQARAAGLGSIAAQFDAIDARRSGRVSFDDYLRYLRSRSR